MKSTSVYVTNTLNTFVTGFAKRGLIQASTFSTLEVCNLPHALPIVASLS